MSHTYTNLLTHVIFSTKDREPLITAALHDDLLAYLGGIVRELGGALRTANARPDHIHLLCSLPPTVATADALRVVKTNSSSWMHRSRHHVKKSIALTTETQRGTAASKDQVFIADCRLKKWWGNFLPCQSVPPRRDKSKIGNWAPRRAPALPASYLLQTPEP
jgi:REP element-mobilizing transposase RayT